MGRRASLALAVVTLGAASVVAGAQRANSDSSARCDSVIAAARADSVAAALFITVSRVDAGDLPPARVELIASQIVALFEPPHPFRLSVFSGAPLMRTLRSTTTAPTLRAPTVTGVYRFVATAAGTVTHARTLRASMMPGFDSAVVTAIRQAAAVPSVFMPPEHEDSMLVDVRFSSDSLRGARRFITASFPRMPVVDAVPRRDNPAAVFPEAELKDSVTTGEVVVRFVVDRTGVPALETVEIVRASSIGFVRSAIDALPKQRFEPATIAGCAVAQVIDYPFSFVLPDPGSPEGRAARH